MKSLCFRSAREARNAIACPGKQSALVISLLASSLCGVVAQQSEPIVIAQQPPAVVTQTPPPQPSQPPSIRVSVPAPTALAPAPIVAATPAALANATPVAQMTVPLAPQTIPAPAFEVYPDYNWGNAMASKLRNAPAKLYEFDRASLRDVLRFLADDAGIPFVALQESSAAENTLVTFTLKASPFRTLETVAKANGVTIFYENGVWFMRPTNEKELVGRIYKIKFNPQDNVKYEGGNGTTGGSANSSSSSSSGAGIGDINMQGATTVFKVETPKLIEQIKSLLGIPTNSVSAAHADEASVENFGSLQTTPTAAAPGSQLAANSTGDGGPQVIYNADSGTVYVIATRQQHQWVEGYLSAVDRPQALIGIEVKFFETTKDPSKELGIDWAGTLQGGFDVSLSNIQASPSGSINIDTNNQDLRQSGQLPSGSSPYDYSTYSKDYTVSAAMPYSAVLSVHDVSVALGAFLSDNETTTVQYPRVLTINNREVVIRSVVNQPVLASSSSVTPGVGGTTTAEVEYLPIGTIINILPKTMPDNSVVLNVAITISSIVGTTTIQGNSYPIASSRIYNAALQVDSGYTLAVGGLEQAFDDYARNGVPFLRDIPGIGELFKAKGRSRSKKNLIIFITPTIITNRSSSPGIAEVPQSVIPVRPNEPTPPAFTPQGRLVGGEAAIDEAARWLERQVEYYRQVTKENRTDKESMRQLASVINSAQMLLTEIQLLEDQNPSAISQLVKKEERTLSVIQELNKVQSAARKDLLSF